MWIITTWKSISPEVTEGLKKCSVFSAVDGTDDMFWNGNEEEGEVRSECEEEEDTH
jgi:hypothetical protein